MGVREHSCLNGSTVLVMPVLFRLVIAADRCHYVTVNVSVAGELGWRNGRKQFKVLTFILFSSHVNSWVYCCDCGNELGREPQRPALRDDTPRYTRELLVSIEDWNCGSASFNIKSLLPLWFLLATVNTGRPGLLSRYSDWLRAGRSGYWIPVGARFFAHVQTGRGYSGYRVFPGGKAAGAWCWTHTPF
jgi:hypothetical protein